MGLLDNLGLPFPGFGQKVPDRQFAQLDPDTQSLINQGVDRSSAPVSAYEDAINQGIQQPQVSNAPSPQEAEQAGVDPNMMTAIRNAYSARSQDSINSLISQNKYKASVEKGQQMNQMAQVKIAQQRVAGQNFAMLTQAYNMQEQSRAQFISQLFQIGGQAGAIGAANRGKAPARGQAGGYNQSQAQMEFDGAQPGWE